MKSALFVGNFLSAHLNRGYSEELADRLEARGWEVVRTSSQLGRVLRLADMLRTTWTQRARYRIAHVDVFSGSAFVWAEATCLLLRALKKPYVLTLRGGNLPDFAARSPGRVRRLLESAALVTAPSSYLVETMRPYRRDLVVLRNAVDTLAYGYRERVAPRPRLTWVRAFHSIYNPVLAIDVLARVSRQWPDATLAMIGPDKDGTLAHVARRARELGIRERLTIVGAIPKREIPHHLADADVFINTTDIDNTPITLLEAMSAGLCVVSTAVGGIPFMVRDEHEAMLVPPRDADAMAGAVARILVEPGLAVRLSREGHASAKQCDWSAILSVWETTLQAVV